MDIYSVAKANKSDEIRSKRKERSKTFQLPNGKKRHLCFGAPIHYWTKKGEGERPDRAEYDDIDIKLNHSAAETGKDFGNYIASKNKFTYGFRDDGKSEKYVGIRRGGDNQMEWTLRGVDLGNIEKTVPAIFTANEKLNDFSFKHSFADYDVITDFNEVHIRTAIKTKSNIDDFTIQEEIDLTGIKITNKLVDGEYVPDEEDRFNFITTDNESLWIPTPRMWVIDGEDRVSREIIHRLFLQGKKIIYEKVPTKKGIDWLKAKSGSVFIDGDTYTGSTGDGVIESLRTNWSSARGGSSGNSYDNNDSYDSGAIGINYVSSSSFNIYRPFLFFDTSTLNSEPDSCDLKVCQYTNNDSDVSAQLSTISGTEVNNVDQYNDFSGSYYGYTNWGSGWNTISFNATGLGNISLDGVTKICLREKSHDYDDSAPSSDTYNGMYFADNATYKPYLDIIEPVVSTFVPQIIMF